MSKITEVFIKQNMSCKKKDLVHSIAAAEELNMDRALFVLSGVTDLVGDCNYTFFYAYSLSTNN